MTRVPWLAAGLLGLLTLLLGTTHTAQGQVVREAERLEEDVDEERSVLEADRVKLRTLDKVTARTRDVTLQVGQTHRLGTLKVTPQACFTAPPFEPPEAKVFLSITENRRGEDSNLPDTLGGAPERRVFNGWMFASDPAANPLEHAVYDVWPMSCSATRPETDGGSTSQSP
jgi:hypothetical protein